MSKVKDNTFAELNAKMSSSESASQEDSGIDDTMVGCQNQYFMNLAFYFFLNENHLPAAAMLDW